MANILSFQRKISILVSTRYLAFSFSPVSLESRVSLTHLMVRRVVPLMKLATCAGYSTRHSSGN